MTMSQRKYNNIVCISKIDKNIFFTEKKIEVQFGRQFNKLDRFGGKIDIFKLFNTGKMHIKFNKINGVNFNGISQNFLGKCRKFI